jgi:hypothetical protein
MKERESMRILSARLVGFKILELQGCHLPHGELFEHRKKYRIGRNKEKDAAGELIMRR